MMGYYLKTDGSYDYLSLPSMTFTKIEMQYLALPTYWQNYLDLVGNTSYRIQAQDGSTNDYFSNPTLWGGSLVIDGVTTTINNGTNMLKKGVKSTIVLTASAAVTGALNIFGDSSGYNVMEGHLYYIKIYNGANLVAHYDMSTGNVNDQSGNGRNATLYGGTWLTDTTTVTSDFTLKQVVYNRFVSDFPTVQAPIFTANYDVEFPTAQTLYKQSIADFQTNQNINREAIEIFPIRTKTLMGGGRMNLGEVKKRALALMSEYSIDGSLISEAENADYLNRMTRFASDAQMEIADKIGVNDVFTFTQASSPQGGYKHYPLPDDFKEHRKVLRNGEPFSNYSIDFRYITLNSWESGTFELFYFKNPMDLTSETPDSYEFEVPRHTHTLIPYFVAAMAIVEEKPSIGDRLLNIYFSRLGQISKKNDVFLDEIKIVYRM